MFRCLLNWLYETTVLPESREYWWHCPNKTVPPHIPSGETATIELAPLDNTKLLETIAVTTMH
ncbi:MAG: hypothetical protein HC795_09615 [Coleofasciculaceae cyanobacterium RL_1_1]|nr:hypothetical protein [Coleofasciculaceae cyanobacterium RL_1_1]